jgi:hypothetical protein
MRRRPRPDDDPTPLRLRRFVPAEWGGDAQAWYDALDEWRSATGESANVDPDITWPDVPFNPAVEL